MENTCSVGRILPLKGYPRKCIYQFINLTLRIYHTEQLSVFKSEQKLIIFTILLDPSVHPKT